MNLPAAVFWGAAPASTGLSGDGYRVGTPDVEGRPHELCLARLPSTPQVSDMPMTMNNLGNAMADAGTMMVPWPPFAAG